MEHKHSPVAGAESEPTDGRRRKGAQRQRQLLDATMRVIEQGGVAAVTQRAVAREADLPPSAVIYYFATIEALLLAALTASNDRCIDRLDHIGSQDRERALDLLAEEIAGNPGDNAGLYAEYELYLLAARNPRLRPELDRWTRALDALVAQYVRDPALTRGVSAAVDGLFLRCLAGQHPADAASVRATLRHLLR